MASVTGLALWIVDCECGCGNTWTHSYPLLYGPGLIGGTPLPGEASRLNVQRLIKSSRKFSCCFSCVPVGLDAIWTVKPRAPLEGSSVGENGPGDRSGRRPRKPSTSLSDQALSDLEKDLFS